MPRNSRHTIPTGQTTMEQPANISITNEFAFLKAYTFATNSLQHLLHGIDAIWREMSRNSHHTPTPSIRFQQITSLNISIAAMAKHLTNARNRLADKKDDKQIEDDIHGTPYPFIKSKIPSFPKNHLHLAQFNHSKVVRLPVWWE